MGKEKTKKNKQKHIETSNVLNNIEDDIRQLVLNEEAQYNQIRESRTVLSLPLTPQMGYIIDKVPERILIDLVNFVKNINLETPNLSDMVNFSLRGNIKHQFNIPINKDLEKYLLFLTNQYSMAFSKFSADVAQDFYSDNNDVRINFKLNNLYTNLEQKYEYNPVHSDPGKLSFIIWLQIPYTYEKELRMSHLQRNNNSLQKITNGSFEFLFPGYHNCTIQKHIINIDSKYEGIILMFPSGLSHITYPFYSSDGFRISVCGSIGYCNN